MYSGFNLKINAERDCGPDSINFLDPGYIKTGETHLGDVSGKVNQELENMVLKGTDIPDGVAIQNDWFPEINADIFISHSHSDRDLANGIAGWINQKFGLRCFIDSNVWGHADMILMPDTISAQAQMAICARFGTMNWDESRLPRMPAAHSMLPTTS